MAEPACASTLGQENVCTHWKRCARKVTHSSLQEQGCGTGKVESTEARV